MTLELLRELQEALAAQPLAGQAVADNDAADDGGSRGAEPATDGNPVPAHDVGGTVVRLHLREHPLDGPNDLVRGILAKQPGTLALDTHRPLLRPTRLELVTKVECEAERVVARTEIRRGGGNPDTQLGLEVHRFSTLITVPTTSTTSSAAITPSAARTERSEARCVT